MFRPFNVVKSTKSIGRSWISKCKFSSSKGGGQNDDLLREGTWNPPPICKGRKIEEDEKKCCPASGTGHCPSIKESECTPTEGVESEFMCCTDPRLKQECDANKKKQKKSKKASKEPFKSMWETLPDWAPNCDIVPRTDETHYKPSDKETRIYRRTWEECDEVKLRKRKVCCFDEPPLPPICKRKEGEKPVTACETDEELLKVDLTLLKECMEGPSNPKTKIERCKKIRMPCCQLAAKNNKCLKVFGPSGCKRECAPYPSFSECVREALRKGPPVECKCTAVPMQCVVFEFMKVKQKFNLPPPVPAWPPQRPK